MDECAVHTNAPGLGAAAQTRQRMAALLGYGDSWAREIEVRPSERGHSCPPERAARTIAKVILPARSERASPAGGQDVRAPSGVFVLCNQNPAAFVLLSKAE